MKLIKIISLILCFSMLYAINDLHRISQDYLTGQLSVDDYVYFQALRIVDSELLPSKYNTNTQIRCATPTLKNIKNNLHKISSETQEKLIEIGFSLNNYNKSDQYNLVVLNRPEDLPESYIFGIFKFHFTTSGDNAVSTSDSDGDGIPDYVQNMAIVFNEVYEKINGINSGQMGFTRPPSDGVIGGGSDLYDIYIFELEPGIYGWVEGESESSTSQTGVIQNGDNEYSTSIIELNAGYSYMAMRNNYSSFLPEVESEAIKATAAHEFFHAVQEGYDRWEKAWISEATAAWIEDEVYDDINNNYQYLPDWFKEPHIALNYDYSVESGSSINGEENEDHWYGSWIFFRYISENMKPTSGVNLSGYKTIQNIWDKSITFDSYDGDYSIDAINAGLNLSDPSYSFKSALNGMAIANVILNTSGYAESAAYKAYSDDGGTVYIKNQHIGIYSNGYSYDYSSGSLMRYAAHYVKITDIPGSVYIQFTPASSEASFQVNAISFSSEVTEIINISPSVSSTTIDFSNSEPDSVIFSIVVDSNSSSENNNYTLTLSPACYDNCDTNATCTNTTGSFSCVCNDGYEGTGIEYDCSEILSITNTSFPKEYNIQSVYPNPFNPVTNINFALPTDSEVSIQIYNLNGRVIETLVNGNMNAGYQSITWNADTFGSGIYFVKMIAGEYVKTQKLMLVK